jgi:hypothetical protein
LELKTISRGLDFIVIGALKGGTTTLFHYLRHHPQIYVPPEKEIPFFSNEKRFSSGWEQFYSEFLIQAPSKALLGKFTPQYMERPARHVPERMFRLMPHVKLIALLRNPIERAYSHYRMEKRFGREARSFEEAFSSYSKGAGRKIYFTASQYGTMLRHYLNYFTRDQLLIHFTDDFEREAGTVLDSICAFLGLPPGFRPPNLGRRYHVGGRQRFPLLTPIVRKMYPLKWLYRSLPLAKRRVIWGWFTNEGNVVREVALPIDPSLRQQLLEYFASDIALLESILEKKVPWKEFQS